jgi:beta-glucosidase
LIDYRHFDYYNLSVQYEFGFGLSYTTFNLSDVSIAAAAVAGNGTSSSATISAHCPSSSTSIPPPGGNAALWQTLYTVSAVVANTGSTAGSAVPQLYLGLAQPPNEDVTPVKVLRGFEKVLLQPGESKTVTFPLMRRDLSYWSTETQGWVIGEGDVRVYAGFSSRDVRGEEVFKVLG